MNNHTKAPWHIGGGNGTGSVFADSGRTRLESGGTTLYPICQVNGGWNDAEDAANARLIASAPDLLNAAQLVIAAWESGDLAEAVRNLDSVVQKATGV